MGRVNPDDVRVLTRLPLARLKADRLRALAAQAPLVTWTMSDQVAVALADIIERGADAVEGIEAQLRAQDQMIDAANAKFAASKVKLEEAMAFRRRSLVVAVGCALMVGTWAAVELTLHLMAALGHG
jgi:hypothetical protein